MHGQQNIKYDYVRLQASSAVRLRSSFYAGMLLGVGWQSGTRLPMKMWPIRFAETSVTDNHPLLRNIPVKLKRKHKYRHTTFQNVIAIGRSVARPRIHRVQRLPVRVYTCMYTRLNFRLFLTCVTVSSSRHQTNKMHNFFSDIFILSHWIYLHVAIHKGSRQGTNPEKCCIK